MERWPSGLRQQFTKLPGSQEPLEFESLSLRPSTLPTMSGSLRASKKNKKWRGVRVAGRTALLKLQGVKSLEGSNPSLSASHKINTIQGVNLFNLLFFYFS